VVSAKRVSVRGIAAAVLALLVVAVLVATIVLGVLYSRARAEEKARDEALAAAQLYVQKMFGWTPENISDNINFMMGHLSGKAKQEYERNIVNNRIAEEVKARKMVARVTDQGSGVVENTRDTAKVLLFINQSASEQATEEVQTNPSRVVYTMERKGGTWLVNDAQLITDQTLQDLVSSDPAAGVPDQDKIGVPAPSTAPSVPAPGQPAPAQPTPGQPAPEQPAPEPVPTG
jgi:Mce-associated membrane protein